MYIRATANISPQSSFSQLLAQPLAHAGNRLTCIEPDYTKLIDPKMIRRMSRIIKMGVAPAIECLREADVQVPGAIITGTAYGCMADTESFLVKMVENNEEFLTPTSFIQSTHNTVGAQIALLLKCHNYNNTFVHRGFSFENALMDAVTYIKDQDAATALVGAVDEITDTSHAILSRFGLYRNDLTSSLDLFNPAAKGTIAGEGSAFFLLSDKPTGKDYAELKSFHSFYRPADAATISRNIVTFLSKASLDIDDISMVILGLNGDIRNDNTYRKLQSSIFSNSFQVNYKHLCGEYPTSSAFALWLAANSIKFNVAPVTNDQKTQTAKLENVLIYNQYQEIHHSLYLLSAC